MVEKELTEVSWDARKLFARGADALKRENYDYAMTLFNQVLDKEPGLLECRKALREAQAAKTGNRGGFLKKMFSGASASPHIAKGQMALRKDPAEALQIAEQVLNTDPFNPAAHRLLAEAAQALEMPRTAALSYEILWKNAPNDKALAFQYADALAGIGEIGRAERLLSELYRAQPTDSEIGQALKNLSARKTLSEGGYATLTDGKGSFRDALRDKEEAVSLEQEKRVVKSDDVTERLIGEYEARLAGEPNNLKLLRSLAELYAQKKRFDEAMAYYDRIKNSETGGDPSLDHAIAETVGRKYDYAISQLDPAAPDSVEKSAALQAEKLAFQLAECQKRVEKYPTDLVIRFEMGQIYFQAGKITEAIQEFQRAQANPHKRSLALHWLGRCFARRGILDLAVRTFQTAIKEKQIFDDEKKDLLYELACVLEKMGKREDAIEQFKLIYEVDIGYKDVAAKIDAYYASQ